ncbi:sugar phosphate nucleotidyltransferase [Breznakiellaceae bacterium SP9]
MLDLSQFIVSEDCTVINAMRAINENRKGTVFICKDGVVLATLTDGDVRRHIISGKSLTAPVSEAANYHFHSLLSNTSISDAHEVCKKMPLNIIPGVDQKGRLVSLFFRDEKRNALYKKIDAPVVVMAGGKGTRLYPYTKILPKPLIPIGDITITEHIMQNFIKFGCNKFTMIVNHKKEMIKAYFYESHINEVSINFIDENEYLGTGGGFHCCIA